MTAASNLLSVRKKLGLTQKELGVLLGISKDMVSKCERGKRNISLRLCRKIMHLCKLKEITDINIDFLRPE